MKFTKMSGNPTYSHFSRFLVLRGLTSHPYEGIRPPGLVPSQAAPHAAPARRGHTSKKDTPVRVRLRLPLTPMMLYVMYTVRQKEALQHTV